MSKKSYKRNQNRLYREIKRRILAEQILSKPIKIATIHRTINTIKIKKILPVYMDCYSAYIQEDLAREITNKLISEGYILFHEYTDDYTLQPAVEAKLHVIAPVDSL